MTWVLKALLQKAISCLPYREQINHWCQRHITHGYPFNEDVFAGYLGTAKMHLASFERFGPFDKANSLCLEFGVGWDLQMALFFYAAGFSRQTCVDLRPLLRLDLVNHNIERLKKRQSTYETLLGCRFHPLPQRPLGSFQDLRDVLGVDYRAPLDMCQTSFPSEHFDLISSSKVLEHVPEKDLPPLLRECHRLLKKSGVMSVDIDMQDHFAQRNTHTSCYNFLQVPDALWDWLQSPLNYQNRLRLPDYIVLLQEAGFDVLHMDVVNGTEQEISQLKQMKLSPRCKKHTSWDALGAKVVTLAVRKNGAAPA